MPDFHAESTLMERLGPASAIVGVDEVGRGPWAGPVTAAAVILDPHNIPGGLNDSKKLTAAKRARLYDEIIKVARWSVVHVSVEEIDALNILQASLLAMTRAVASLPVKPDYALIDGNKLPKDLLCPAQAIVGGDGKSLSISAASIVAKITRDRLMESLAQQYPGYGWETNSGYGTKMHQNGLQNLGVTPFHRRSFKPIHKILCEEKTVSR